MKRAYKLQEFVAHTSNVNCLKIGKKSSRVLVTGGEDHKVNMWAIGKPNAILSLSGHSSAVESVTFDSSEALVVAGAASGTIKLWDLEEAKLVRNLTGHRSNCISVDFHPFGEFFASGSLDTNLKIWDIRRKTCIHTYKGHTRGVNAIKFSPDGRWVVSGGEDNVVKLWDLTAGKLMHDFKSHEGQIHCVDFHPQEFLLATGSADRTVRFWDLETFELIGTAGPETSGVRSMIFNPDGRTLLAGLHESLKVFSWEPLRSFDAVDVGWSKLADLNVHEGKLLGCSYNQSCVGVWVVDISRVGPYASVSIPRTNGTNEAKPAPGGHQPSQQVESSLKSSVARLSLSHSSEQGIKETKPSSMAGENVPATPHRVGVSLPLKNHPAAAPTSTASYALTPKRNTTSKVQPTANFQSTGRSVDVAPIIVPRSSSTRADTSTDAKRETCNIGRTATAPPLSRSIDMAKAGSNRDEPDKIHSSFHSVPLHQKRTAGNEKSDQDFCRAEQSFSPRSEPNVPNPVMSNEGSQSGIRWMGAPKLKRNLAGDSLSVAPDRSSSLQWPPSVVESGRARALVESWEKREKPIGDMHSLGSGRSLPISGNDSSSVTQRGGIQAFESDKSASEENVSVEELIEQHSTITSVLQTRLTKLQVIKRFWQRNDLKGAIEALKKMGDHSVSSDIISALNERSEVFNLDICIVALPLLTRMLESEAERHLSVTLDTLLMIMKMFGDVIRSTMAAAPTIGVDLHAEQRVEKCKSCYTELQKIKQRLNPLTRKGGAISKSAQELSSALQEF